MEGTVGDDAGAEIRDGIKSVAKIGAPPEKDWPYDISKFTNKPPAKAYSDAKLDRAIQYQRLVPTLAQQQGCLAAGFGYVFGFTVYESFELQTVAQTGVMPMPKPNEKKLGGHAVMTVGYDTASRMMIVRNSWKFQEHTGPREDFKTVLENAWTAVIGKLEAKCVWVELFLPKEMFSWPIEKEAVRLGKLTQPVLGARHHFVLRSDRSTSGPEWETALESRKSWRN